MSCLLSNLQKDTNSAFNTIEDSGIDAKFVNVVYDALLNTVSRRKEFMFDNLSFHQVNFLRSSLYQKYFSDTYDF